MAQILLLELVGRGPDKPDNVVVVGDDDQSIYRFRGASYAAFEQFETRFETAPDLGPRTPSASAVASLPLLENRRSTGNILSAASRLIGHNQKRLKKGRCVPIKDAGLPLTHRPRRGRARRGGRRRRAGSRRRSRRCRRRGAGATSRSCTASTATAT